MTDIISVKYLLGIVIALAFGISGCGPKPSTSSAPKWWSEWLEKNEIFMMEVDLKPAESKVIKISETGSAMLGILVKERTELRKIMMPDGTAVFLRQTATHHFVGTSRGAATAFNLGLGDEFTVENTSGIQTHVVVYVVKN